MGAPLKLVLLGWGFSSQVTRVRRAPGAPLIPAVGMSGKTVLPSPLRIAITDGFSSTHSKTANVWGTPRAPLIDHLP